MPGFQCAPANAASHKPGKLGGLDNERDLEVGPSSGTRRGRGRDQQGRVLRGPRGIQKRDGLRHSWKGKEKEGGF